MFHSSTFQRGFSLIGLFLLVSFFIVLLAVGLFIVNPAKQYAQENNTTRANNVLLIANALGQYITHQGNVPPNMTLSDQEISGGGVDLCKLLVPDYIVAFPKDPALNSQDATTCPTEYTTGYTIRLNNDNSFTISAPATAVPPAKEIISVTRKIIYEK